MVVVVVVVMEKEFKINQVVGMAIVRAQELFWRTWSLEEKEASTIEVSKRFSLFFLLGFRVLDWSTSREATYTYREGRKDLILSRIFFLCD